MKKLCIGLAATVLLATGSAHAFKHEQKRNNPVAVGDIVAHDLPTWQIGPVKTKFGKRFGHIGFYQGGGNTMEVWVGYKPTIQDFHLTQTKNGMRGTKVRPDMKYWGAKYGIRGQNGFKSIQFGREQRAFSPTYTYSPWAKVGKITKKWKRKGWKLKRVTERVNGKYRCDSFVYEALKKSGVSRWNMKTYTAAGPLRSPKMLYDTFPKHR